ncbi:MULTISPECIES: hypothetical protein [Caballeronia]|jgi:hypothetical protein|uniref:Uncharacterized protein n=1 Tax=Caballeronia grimmiae TaxID=1071679 RepID=A0ABQ1RBI5_9BURK|nr:MULTISPECIES: hypothetical protein [Caballeronia]MDR5735655.1 hypothetical protein [Caballeronia sp. LZ025]MDR5739323.1 hypothetical protein [Caballeronia sp. LZ016]MDR5807812.1 hypothetical protein [Caballeronia sp. LZ019]GGD62574.1 hypothetical protein GCM10010985_15870 [Caballeronia grimmiae]
MTKHKTKLSMPRRQAFRCSGQQLDAIMRFAEERKFDEQPLQWVVAQYCRSQAKAA